MSPRSRTALFLAAAVVVYLAATLIGIDRYPRVWVDEGWIAEPAWSLAQGGPFASVSHGDAFAYDTRLYWMPPLQFLTLAGVYAFGPDPLLAGRIVSAAAGLLGLCVLWAWGRGVLREAEPRESESAEATGRRTALWPLLFLLMAFTFDPILWKAHRTIRFESLVGLFTLIAVAAAWRRGGSLRGPLAGAAAGLAVLTHPNGILAVAAAGGLLVLRARNNRIRDVARFGVLVLLTLSPYFVYLAGDAAAGFRNVLGQNASHFHGDSGSVFARWLDEGRRYAAYFAWPRLAPVAALWVAAIVLAARRRAPAGLWWLLAVTVGGVASVPNKTELYVALVAPVVYLLAAWALAARPSRAWAVACSAWLALLAGADAYLLARNGTCRYDAWMRPALAAVPDSAAVAGSYVAWFPFKDRPFLEIGRHRAGDLIDARPEYVLWDERQFGADQFARLRDELGSRLRAHADTVASMDAPCYGRAAVLRVRWDEIAPPGAPGWERYREDVEAR